MDSSHEAYPSITSAQQSDFFYDEERDVYAAREYGQLSRSANRAANPNQYVGVSGNRFAVDGLEFPPRAGYSFRLPWRRLPADMNTNARRQILRLRQDFEKIVLDTTICHNNGRYDDGPGRVLGAGEGTQVALQRTRWGRYLVQQAISDGVAFTQTDHPNGPKTDIDLNNPKRFLSFIPGEVSTYLVGRKIVYGDQECEWWDLPLDVKAEVFDIIMDRRGAPIDYGDIRCGQEDHAPTQQHTIAWDQGKKLVVIQPGDTRNELVRRYDMTWRPGQPIKPHADLMQSWNLGYRAPNSNFENPDGEPKIGHWYIVAGGPR